MVRLRHFWLPLLLAVITGAGLVAWRVVSSPAGVTWAAGELAVRLTVTLGTPVAIASATPDGGWIELHDVRIGPDGHLARVRRARIQVVWSALWQRQLHLRALEVDGARIRTSEWPSADESTTAPAPPPLRIDHFDLRHVRIRGPGDLRWRATATASGALHTTADAWQIVLEQLLARSSDRTLAPIRATGEIAYAPATTGVRADRFTLQYGDSRAALDGQFALQGPIDLRVTDLHLTPADLHTFVPQAQLHAPLDGAATMAGEWPQTHLTASLRTDAGGDLTLDGHVTLAPPYSIAASCQLHAIDPAHWWTGAPAGRLNGTLQLRAAQHDDGWHLAERLALTDSRFEQWTIHSGRLRARGSAERQRGQFLVATPEGRVHADADIELTPALSFRVAGTANLPATSRFVPAHSSKVQTQFIVSQRPGDAMQIEATSGAVRVADVPLDAVTVRAQYRDRLLDVAQLAVTTGGGAQLVAHGPLDWEGDRTALDLGGRVDARALNAIVGTPLEGVATVTGKLHGRWPPTIDATAQLPTATVRGIRFTKTAITATVDLAQHTGRAALTAEKLQAGNLPPGPARTRLTWSTSGAATTARIEELTASSWRLTAPATLQLADGVTAAPITLQDARGAIVVASGRLGGTRGNDLALRLSNLPLTTLCPPQLGGRCGGQVNGTARLTGRTLDADVQVTRLTIDDVAYGTVTLAARSSGGRISVDTALQHPTAGTLSVVGTVPALDAGANAPLDLRLVADRFDPAIVAALFPTHLRHVRGTLVSDLTIRGPWSATSLGGSLSLENGSIGIATNGVTYENVHLRVEGHGRDLVVQALSATTGDGRVDGTGRLQLGSAQGLALDLDLQLQKAQIANRPAVTALATGSLAVHGSLATPTISGTVELSDTTLRPSLLPMTRSDLQPDPTIRVTDSRPQPKDTVSAPTNEPPAPVILDFTVTLGDDVWIRRSDAALALGGTLRIKKELTEPSRIVGRVALGRGWYTFQDHRFNIEGGSVVFKDTVPTTTVLDVTASNRSAEYTITAKVGGSLEQPALTLFSDPPLPEADVLSVLLFGKPAQQLGASETGALQNQAVAIATGYVVPGLRSSVMDVLGIDTFDVSLPPPGATDTAGQVRLGRYVADDLFVSLAQEFGAGVAQVFGIEYVLSRRWSVRASAATNGRGAIDVFWHRRY